MSSKRKASFYRHYRSKHEFILTACTHYYQTHLQRLHAETTQLMTPRKRLRRALELSIRICVADEHNPVFTSELFAMSLHDKAVRAGWAQFYNAVREMLIGLEQWSVGEGGSQAPADAAGVRCSRRTTGHRQDWMTSLRKDTHCRNGSGT